MEPNQALLRSRPADPPLRYALHPARVQPARAMLLVHGQGEHSARYHYVVDKWCERGLSVGTFDLRGHGVSGGRRGHIDSFQQYVDDTLEVLEALQQQPHFSDLGAPVLFGHSLGGLIAFHVALAAPGKVRALVLTSPFFGLAMQVPAAKRLAGRLMSRLVPGFSMATGIRGNQVTHDPQIAAAYDTDALMARVASARWFTEVLEAQQQAFDRAPSLRMPILCLQGGADTIVDKQRSREVVERTSSEQKRFEWVEGAYHEVLNETDRDRSIGVIADFVLALD